MARGEIVRLPRIDDGEWAQRERIWQREISAQENSVADVEGSASIICQWIVLVRDKARLRCSPTGKESTGTPARTRIALCIIQNIEAKQGNPAARTHAHICDQLVLAKNSARRVLINVLVGFVWRRASGNIWRIDIVDVKRMLAARVQISDGHSCIFCNLTFNAGSTLDSVRRSQIRRDLVRGRRRR